MYLLPLYTTTLSHTHLCSAVRWASIQGDAGRSRLHPPRRRHGLSPATLPPPSRTAGEVFARKPIHLVLFGFFFFFFFFPWSGGGGVGGDHDNSPVFLAATLRATGSAKTWKGEKGGHISTLDPDVKLDSS